MVGKILIAGYGSVGQYVLDLITRMEETRDCEILVMSRTEESEIIPRINTTLVSAGIMGFYPRVRYIQNDLNDIETTARIIHKERPDTIAFTGRFIKGIKYGAYSYPNNIGYGAWIPLAIPLIYKLMKAVKASGVDCRVINTSFPDGVCPALASVGLEPMTGAGNLNHLVPRISMALAQKYGVSPSEIDVRLIGSHYLNTYVSKEGSSKGSPYYLEFTSTEELHVDAEIDAEVDIFPRCKIPMMSNQVRNLMVASDVAQIIKATHSEDKTFKMHLPGPGGLIGGYPALINKYGFILDLPSSVNISQAIRINADNLRYDGIEAISNGEITFTDDILEKMKSVFGIDYPKTIKVEDCEEFAYQIKSKLEEYEKGNK